MERWIESEDVVPSPELIAAWVRIGRIIPSDELPLWAAHWMTWGHDGPAVTALAALHRGDTPEIHEALPPALEEMGATVGSLTRAAKIVYDDLANEHLTGKRSMAQMLALIESIVVDSGYSEVLSHEPLGALYGLVDELDSSWGRDRPALAAEVYDACERQLGRSREDRWYTIRAGADRLTVDAAYRGALIAQRHRLRHIDVDLISDRPWPDEVRWAVEAGTELAQRRRRRSRLRWLSTKAPVTLRIDPDDDDAFAIAVALAPYSIGGTGLDNHARIVWDGSDTGTSAAFRLTETELLNVRAFVADRGGDAGSLVPLETVRARRSRS